MPIKLPLFCKRLASLLSIFLLLASQTACTSTRLPPYEATYTSKYRGIKIKGVRKFEATGENRYKLSWKAKALWMKLNEWSEFEVIDEQVRPLSYHYTRKGLGSDRPIHIFFDWEAMQVNASKGDKKYQYALEPGVLDKLSYQVQLQIDLIHSDAEPFYEYRVANYNNLRDYRFDYKQDALIDAYGDKQEKTRVYERSKRDRITRLWVSPSHNYLPIQIEQIDDGTSNIAVIRSWDSTPLQLAREAADPSNNNDNPVDIFAE